MPRDWQTLTSVNFDFIQMSYIYAAYKSVQWTVRLGVAVMKESTKAILGLLIVLLFILSMVASALLALF